MKKRRLSEIIEREELIKASVLILLLLFATFIVLMKDSRTRSLVGKAGETSCILNSAQWSKTNAKEGELINMIVTGTGCNGYGISFNVYEYDAIGTDSLMNPSPITTVFSGSTAQASWRITIVQDYELLLIPTSPEYYFTAHLTNLPSTRINNSNMASLLNVTETKNALYNINTTRFLEEDAATITWDSEKESNSVVKYGLDQSYASTRYNSRYVVEDHRVTIQGLEPNTKYYYNLSSITKSGVENISRGYFTTLPHNPETIIVDNSEAGFSKTGSWEIDPNSGIQYAQDSLRIGSGQGSFAKWSFYIENEGEYRAYVWWVTDLLEANSMVKNAKYEVQSKEGIKTVFRNQESPGSGWNVLGKFNFSEGERYVRLLSESSEQGQISADAIKVTRVSNKHCNEFGGYICDYESEICNGAFYNSIEDYCCNTQCADAEHTCSMKSGHICSSTQTCLVDYRTDVKEQRCCPEPCIEPGTSTGFMLMPSALTVYPNDTFTIRVLLANVQEVKGYEFAVRYDTDMIDVIDYNHGGFLWSTSGEVQCTGVDLALFEETGYVKCNKLGSDLPSGNGIVSEITFIANMFGATMIEIINATLWTAEGNVPVTATPSIIEISEGDCTDFDEDGFLIGPPHCRIGNDCNDMDPFINPMMLDFCDGIDNNCMNGVDEYNEGIIYMENAFCEKQEGVCYGSYKECKGTLGRADCTESRYLWYDESYASDERSEEADGLDNDCDSTIDEFANCVVNGQERQCGKSQGACISGIQKCENGKWTECLNEVGGSAEACDGLDNDCDGDIDEGCDDDGDKFCDSGMTFNATFAYYLCPNGGNDCNDNSNRSYPGGTEVCDGLDNDCNGTVDDMVWRYDINNCGACNKACFRDNSTNSTCNLGVCTIANCSGNYYDANEDADDGCEYFCEKTNNATEICDGLDNDCDSKIDEVCNCTINETQSCGSAMGECTKGTQTCIDGEWGSCEGGNMPSPEECDGKDNDCDGDIDEDLTAPSCELNEGVCINAKKVCGGSGGWQACTRTSYGSAYRTEETSADCDGLDNDCDGDIDEGCETFDNGGYAETTSGNDQDWMTNEMDQGYEEDFADMDGGGGGGLMFIALIGLVVVLLGAVGYLLYNSKKKSMPKSTPSFEGEQPGVEDLENLKKYISKTLDMGFTDVEIGHTLAEAGWNDRDIAEAFDDVKRTRVAEPKEKRPEHEGPVQKKIKSIIDKEAEAKRPDEVLKELKEFSEKPEKKISVKKKR
ncbi:hypothetical protein JXA85_01110 [Candidatus Woesearchaeota archaeon]|nr:hypothetical protein [Candidatus Woesearchaeota archaeon]